MLTLRFDMRAPQFGASTTDLYAAAIEMCAWAEHRGAVAAVLSEHHATDDGHLSSPLVLASAIAARTERLAILVAALVLPLYDPVRLAEDMSVLDIVSRGRVAYALGVGHRAEEYEHLGVSFAGRGAVADRNLALLLKLLRGEAVEHDGRGVRVSPPPATDGGPRVMIAGGSRTAVRRAARHGLGFLSQVSDPGLRDLYEVECLAHGHPVGAAQLPDGGPTATFVADDVDRAWAELGPHLLHDATTASAYRPGQQAVASITRATTVEELRRSGGAYAVLEPSEAEDVVRSGRGLRLHPLCGGLPPDLAWPYLERAAAAAARPTKEDA